MSIGLQINDAQGAVVLDTSMRTGRILGSIATSGDTGSVIVPTVVGTPFLIVTSWPRPYSSGQFGTAFVWGDLSFDGTTIKWNFTFGSPIYDSITIYYGSY
ncbi:hypothetical protein [Dyella sp. 2RAB6]|uniref:hypothetical protein n=1 Tax=Dyella sp. 2RAB6 TaxID=3232992 RepID=UPI003F9101D5